jgi:hypothetical protein
MLGIQIDIVPLPRWADEINTLMKWVLLADQALDRMSDGERRRAGGASPLIGALFIRSVPRG